MPHLLIATDYQHFIGLLRHITHSCELDGSLIKIFVLVAHACLALEMQVVEVSAATHVTTCKAEIVFEPVDAAYLVDMPLAYHILRTLSGVEIEYVDGT